jgi:hypothetical protein
MVGEVIDDDDSALFSSHFSPSLDVLEVLQCFSNFFFIHTPRIGCDDHGKTIEEIELAYQWCAEVSPELSFSENLER